MITEIRLKKGSGVPSSLQLAEPAIDLVEKILYIGATDNENGGSDFIRIIDENKVKELIAQNALGSDLILVGDGENSIVLNSVDNKAFGDYSVSGGFESQSLSDYSIAIGKNNKSGLFAYYIKSVDIENKKIYLCNEKVVPVVSTDDNTDTSFETPAYEIGSEFSLIAPYVANGRDHYSFVGTISAIQNNVVTCDIEKFPFSSLYDDAAIYSPTFYVPTQPEIGVVDIGGVSFAEGENTYASGKWCHTEGWGTVASGRFAHAEGLSTKAGYGAHAEGNGTLAKGHNSHAEGYLTEATNQCSHTEGRESIASGFVSHAEGYKTISSGSYSHSEGWDTEATASSSHAEGSSTRAYGQNSHSEGYDTESSGLCSHSEGKSSIASNESSHAEGNGTFATAKFSHAEGSGSTASAQASHAEGTGTTSSNESAHAEGNKTTSSGKYSHSEGDTCTATGQSNHAEGQTCHATGKYGAHAEGFSSKATAVASHAENRATQANGDYSHSEGEYAIANALGSHAEGKSTQTITGANYSHVEGIGTITRGEAQHVQGKYNIQDLDKKYAHIVGNGTNEVRSNAHTLDWDGNAWFAGDVIVGENNKKLSMKSLQYYGDVDIIPSDNDLFTFTVDNNTMTATAKLLIDSGNHTFIVPYEYIENNKRYRVSDVSVAGGYVERLILSNSVQSVYFFDTTVDNVIIPNSVTTIEISENVDTSQFVIIGDIYFRGTKSEWDAIEIGGGNGCLLDATIHYEWSDVTKGYVDEKINDVDSKTKSLQYYGDVDIIPSDASLFSFTINDDGETASVVFNGEKDENGVFIYEGELVIPYECTIEDKKYSVTSIGQGAFRYCSSLTNVTIPESVTSIDGSAFRGCSSLTSITIPDSVTSIGDYAFYDCSSLTIIEIPDSVTSIGDHAFYDCSSLTSIEIPDSVTNIGDYTFDDCSSLTSIEIPDSVTNIGSRAFENCSSLTSITIPASLTNIEDYTFRGCIRLTSIMIPDSVTSIGSYAFSRCSRLTSITIPDGVTSIGLSAFGNCTNLTDVYFKEKKTQWDAITIADSNDALLNATIHYEWTDVTKGYVDERINAVDEKIGNIETALDNIIVIQEDFITPDGDEVSY